MKIIKLFIECIVIALLTILPFTLIFNNKIPDYLLGGWSMGFYWFVSSIYFEVKRLKK